MKRINFSGVQQLGRALMLPIAVLPAAALLMRFGQPDLLNLSFVASAGEAIFANLGLLFAIGIAVGFAKENNGAAALAGAVGYFVTIKGAGVLLELPSEIMAEKLKGMTQLFELRKMKFLLDEASRMSIPVGIVTGLSAGILYNRFHAIRLPEYLAFFGGRRFVPIIAGFLGLLWALIFGKTWPLLSAGLDNFSSLLSQTGNVGLFIYGVLNRLLIVTGLHHILNNVVWFLHGSFVIVSDSLGTVGTVVTGDLNRFSRGDPTAGAFMAGFFPVMMFGLPAACLAMYRNALSENKRIVAGMLLSMALTSFLTGITEPIEFAFMFIAPVLYVIHALLTGLSSVIMNILDVKLGFGFSAGFIDYLINFNKSTHPWYLLPIGAAYFVVYYVLFDFTIRVFNLKTLGRGRLLNTSPQARENSLPANKIKENTKAMILALGGPKNLYSVGACATRLRLTLRDSAIIDENKLAELGAHGIIRPDASSVQVILGPIADVVATEIDAALKNWKK